MDILSFVALFFALVLFFYMAFYRTAVQNKKYFYSLRKNAEAELSVLSAARLEKMRESRALSEQQKQRDTKTATGPISDVPMFLQKINNDTIASGLELSNIKKLGDTTFELTAFAPFDRLVNFLFYVEKSNLAVQDMDIYPFSDRKNKIILTLRLISQDMSDDNRRAIQDFQKINAKQVRNPFRRGTGDREIDLTRKYKLSGIGFDKAKYASINRKNYYVGDIFYGMQIVAIHNDRVDLEADSQKFFISFRYKRPLSERPSR